MSQHMQRKIFWGIIVAVMIAILVVIRIMEIFFPNETASIEEPVALESIEIVDKSIILFSDSAINSEKTILQSEKIATLFNETEYIYNERVVEYGMLNMLKPIMSYTDAEIKKTEYLVISGGFLDMIADTEIGDFDDAETTIIGYLKKNIEHVKEISPNTKIILLGIPCHDLTGADQQYNINDYNLALEMLGNYYDNVYYIDLYSLTLDKPLVMKSTEYRYDYNTIQIIYSQLIETMNTIENTENDTK